MERGKEHCFSSFSNFPFPIVQQHAFRKLWICLLLIALSLHTTVGLAAKSPYETIEQAASYILKHQNEDGGWPLIPGEESDIEVTAFAMLALMLKDQGSGSGVIRRGVSYLVKHQKADGSWNGNVAHTIFAAIALKRAEAVEYWEAHFNALKWLEDAQKEDGSWGREIRQPGNPLYTGAALTGFGLLDFDRESELVTKAADWLAGRINYDGGWSMEPGARSSVLVTSWVLQGLSIAYNIDEQLAWLKQMQNDDGGFGMWKGAPSDPEITAYAVLALVIGEDPLNADQVALRYLREVQQEDGSFVSATPIELKQPTANLQTTCFALWAIYAERIKGK